MLLPKPLLLLASLTLTCATPPPQHPLIHHASHESSFSKLQQNAPRILNTLASSLRQFPASIHHNGMSFFPASIPAKTLLYHGTHTKDVVKGMEWLAFEIEHASIFARANRPRGPPGRGRLPPGGDPPFMERRKSDDDGEGQGEDTGEDLKRGEGQERMMNGESDEEEREHGYLHIYQTRHALTRLLYIDGMSAAKCPLGTLDTTDLILLNDSLSSPPSPFSSNHQSKQDEESRKEDEPPKEEPWHPNSDYARAQGLCELGKEWGLEGIIRMEAGFELILCDFSAHLDLLSANQRPDPPKNEQGRRKEDQDGEVDVTIFEYLRALEQRYNGITDGRIEVDYSNMVSAYFYSELNLTNPDVARGDLPRLPTDDLSALSAIKSDLGAVFLNSGSEKGETINWQGTSDMIISRYTTRLPFLAANETSAATMLADIGVLLDLFIDYGNVNITSSHENCGLQYLRSVTPKTKSDYIIFEALWTVTSTICGTLFDIREALQSSSVSDSEVEEKFASASKGKIVKLMKYLDWTTWKECGKCAVDEVCFVAIWPWGGVEDHEKPSCVGANGVRERRGYWNTRF